ncbi:hypothetical protein KY331_05400 [Candidatus Woesearchaeota archaeon]|nr:hypothetical protein [Candidatus Woesearchaeota archaeon]
MLSPIFLLEGARIIVRSFRVKFKGVKKYKGDVKQICRQIIEDCWNGRYFQVSAGHFCEFYARDFGWCTHSLLNLGYKDKVIKTLDYALGIYSKNKRITTTIDPRGRILDVYTYSPDSLAYLMRSLRLANAKNLIKKYKPFLETEVKKFFDIVFDKDKGIVKENTFFSSMKDHSVRNSSCYNNIMVAMLSKELDKLKFENPFKEYNLKKIIKEKFWTGEYFLDDLSGNKFVAGDANIYPFWTGVFTDKKMLKSTINKIIEKKLDEPFPLKYSEERKGKKFTFIEKIFVPNYEGSAIWIHMGPLYLELLRKVNKTRYNLLIQRYKNLIEKHKNYLEVFNANGSIYKTFFYHTDESMLWAANFLDLMQK